MNIVDKTTREAMMLAVQLNAIFCIGCIAALLWLIGTMVTRVWPAIAAALAFDAGQPVRRAVTPALQRALAA